MQQTTVGSWNAGSSDEQKKAEFLKKKKKREMKAVPCFALNTVLGNYRGA